MTDKRVILYVDDEPNNLIAFRSVFRRHYKVSTASGGDEAIQLLKNQSVDIVLTDHKMPQMTGVELCQYIHEHYPGIPRMIVTGYPDQTVIGTAIEEGFIGKYITKPWDPDELINEIEACMA